MKYKIEEIAINKGYRITQDGNVIGVRGNRLSNKLVNKVGYKYFSVKHKQKKFNVSFHRLQAYQKHKDKLFDDGIVVRHLDGDKLNNSLENISIGTRSENMMDIPKEIRMKTALLATSKVRKHNKEKIRGFHKKNSSYNATMKEFNISSKGTLHFILNS